MSTTASSLERAFRGEADRLSLFGADAGAGEVDALRNEHGKLPPDAFRLLRQRTGEERRRGRPLGALNKRSEQLAKLVTQEFGDPVLGMASIYAMPLDQLVEALLIADGTIERRERLDELLDGLTKRVRDLAVAHRGDGSRADIDRLADACEALESTARTSQGKPGDLAVKALNLQLAARRAVAEYVHSKKPVEANVNLKSDGVIVMPGMGGGGFGEIDAATREAGEVIARALASGSIDVAQLAGMKLLGGQLVDAEFVLRDDPDGSPQDDRGYFGEDGDA